MRLRRSCLYVPGDKPRAIAKALTLPADALILDLEDAVAPEAKEAARSAVVEALRGGGFGRRERIVRINGLRTAWGEADLAALDGVDLDAILLPKVEDAASLIAASAAGFPLWAMIETPRAVLGVQHIAAAAERVPLTCLVAGTNDLVAALRCAPGPRREPLLPALCAIVTAARAYGLDAIDGVHNEVDDEAGLIEACHQGRTLGFDGKSLIHPSQIVAAHKTFSPSDAEIAEAKAIVAAFADPANRDKGVLRVNGRQAERLHLDWAQRILAQQAASLQDER